MKEEFLKDGREKFEGKHFWVDIFFGKGFENESFSDS